MMAILTTVLHLIKQQFQLWERSWPKASLPTENFLYNSQWHLRELSGKHYHTALVIICCEFQEGKNTLNSQRYQFSYRTSHSPATPVYEAVHIRKKYQEDFFKSLHPRLLAWPPPTAPGVWGAFRPSNPQTYRSPDNWPGFCFGECILEIHGRTDQEDLH